jgi:hypothetical protein
LRNDLNSITDIGFDVVSRDVGTRRCCIYRRKCSRSLSSLATKSFFHIGMGAIDQYQWFGLDDEFNL